MDYKILNRPKLPRNKYGQVEDKTSVGGGTSYFSTSSNPDGSGSGTADISVFVGSTNSQDGKKGLVPAPKTNNDEPLIDNDNQKFLKGNGGWTDIPVSRYTTENVNKDGINLNGNLNVTDTLTAQTLNVTGAAHFWELVIDKVKAAGGNLLITPANFIVDYIGSDVNYNVDATQSPFNLMFYNSNTGTGIVGLQELFTNQSVTQLKAKRLYQKNSDGENKISCEVEICDMIRCKTFNLDEGNSDSDSEIDFSNKDYWTFVLGTGEDTYNNEPCNYIDVLYQYVANGSTYGLGTTIEWQDVPPDTHLTYCEETSYEWDMYDSYGIDPYETNKVVILTSDKSSGGFNPPNPLGAFVNIVDNGNSLFTGNIDWDGTGWYFNETNNYIYPNDSFTVSGYGNGTGYIECVQDSRWTNPVLKIIAKDGVSIPDICSLEGNFYVEDYISPSTPTTPDLESFKFGYGEFIPAVGDNLITLGHLVISERQNAILISSYDPMDPELQAPAIAQYAGINQFTSLSPFRTTSIASNGNTFLGKFLVNNDGVYMDIDQKLNMFVVDLNSGLESVGIHLDGENSTIKMIGSVEIKQNGDGTTDTLTVWDDDNIMRVKISPETIPSKSNIQTDINPTTTVNFKTLTGQNYPTSGTTSWRHTWTEVLWWTTDHLWQYWLDNAYYDYITYYDIGTFSSGAKITLSNLKANIRSKAYFKGQDYVSTRSGKDGQGTTHTQSISTVILRLKRKNGSTWTNVTSYNLLNTAVISVANETASISYPSTVVSDYTISTAGTYRLEFEVVFNVYAYISYQTRDGQSNPYFMFDNSFNSSIVLTQPSSSMTRIGRNGIVFNTDSAGQYFYSGNDGIEMKWGDSSITLDGTNGLKTNVAMKTITDASSKYISRSASFVNCTGITSAATVYLPSTSNYGVGRIITILCNDYVTISTYSSSENIYTKMNTETSNTNYPSMKTYPFNSSRTIVCSTTDYTPGDEYTSDQYYRTHIPFVRLMCDGSGWYRI